MSLPARSAIAVAGLADGADVDEVFRVGLDLNGLGERTVTLDCDVLQADGGTRTASISGA